ncbi:hypothetical protein BLOT_010104 [Blomia tropicalis]|nr:hypothetical protein BLOT_010104 [Blomia tropicalis]
MIVPVNFRKLKRELESLGLNDYLIAWLINTNNNSYFTTYLQDTCVCVCWAQIVTSSAPGVGLMMRDEMR